MRCFIGDLFDSHSSGMGFESNWIFFYSFLLSSSVDLHNLIDVWNFIYMNLGSPRRSLQWVVLVYMFYNKYWKGIRWKSELSNSQGLFPWFWNRFGKFWIFWGIWIKIQLKKYTFYSVQRMQNLRRNGRSCLV